MCQSLKKINPLDTLSGNLAYSKAKEFYEKAEFEFYQGNDSLAKELYSKATKLLPQSNLLAEDYEFLNSLENLERLEEYNSIKDKLNGNGNGIKVTQEEIEKILYSENEINIGEKFAKKIAYQEKKIKTKQNKWFKQTLEKLLEYEPFIDSLLLEKNMPEIFKYSFPVESAMNPSIRSKAGALGIAQWMKSSAKLWNLKVETRYDERLDPIKALPAAINYLNYLYSFYDDPDLSIAAYNWGNARILKSLERTNSSTYNELLDKGYLPKETENHLPKIHAFRNLAKEIKIEIGKKDPILKNLITNRFDQVSLDQQTSLIVMAKVLEMPLKNFKKYNPAYPMGETPRNKINQNYNYPIRMPKGKGKGFLEKLSKVKKRIVSSQGRYKIKKGDTLSDIALKHQMSVGELKRLNNLRSNKIIAGKYLKIISK